MKKILQLLLVAALPFYMQPVSAGIMGSDIGWECLGNDSFLIYIDVYRDCTDSTVAAGSIEYWADASQCSITLPVIYSAPLQIMSVTDVSPRKDCSGSLNCTQCDPGSCSYAYGVQKIRLEARVYLGNIVCCHVYFSWQQQRRTAHITTGPANTSFYTRAWINKCMTSCINSPVYEAPPVHLLCPGNRIRTYAGIERNAANAFDNITYHLVSPRTAPSTDVLYNSGFTYVRPVTFQSIQQTNLTLNALGLLSTLFNSATVQTTGQKSIFSTELILYTGTTKVGTVRREHYIMIDTICDATSLTGIGSPKDTLGNSFLANTVDFCKDDTFCFTVDVIYPSDFNPEVKWYSELLLTLDNISVSFPFPGETVRTYKFCYTPLNIGPGNYSMHIMAKTCMKNFIDQSNIKLQVEAPPVADIQYTTDSCGWVNFSAISQDDISEYNWTVQNQEFYDSTFNYHFTANGSYPVMLHVKGNHCDTILHDTVHIQLLQLNSLPDTFVCENQQLIYAASHSGGHAPYTYLWLPDSSINQQLIVSPDQSRVYSLKVTDATGCEANTSFNITVHPNNTQVMPDFDICVDAPSLQLTASPAGGVWSGPGVSGNEFNPALTGQGSFVIYYDPMENHGCGYVDSVQVIVHPVPVVHAGPDLKVCEKPESEVILLGTPSGGSWHGPGVILTSGQYRFSNKQLTEGVYYIYYTVVDVNNCTHNDTIGVSILPSPEVVVQSVDPLCENDAALQLMATPTGGFWTGAVDSSGKFDPPIAGSGNHHLYYVYKNSHACSDTGDLYITVHATPLADFSASPIVGNKPLEVQFTDQSVGSPVKWHWQFTPDLQDTSDVQHPVFIYENAGSYTVTLIVENNGGCSDTLSREDYIEVDALGIKLFAAGRLKIYPNPNPGKFLVELPDGIKMKEIRLVSVEGKQIPFITNGTAARLMVEIPGATPGNYIIRIYDEKGNLYSGTIIVTRE